MNGSEGGKGKGKGKKEKVSDEDDRIAIVCLRYLTEWSIAMLIPAYPHPRRAYSKLVHSSIILYTRVFHLPNVRAILTSIMQISMRFCPKTFEPVSCATTSPKPETQNRSPNFQ